MFWKGGENASGDWKRSSLSESTMTKKRGLHIWHFPLTSARQHLSYGDCLEVKREYYQNCSVLGCVTQCSLSAAQFLHNRSSRLGFSHWDPYAMHRGGSLELYYCNMVEWCWWHSSLIRQTNWFPSVLWCCCFGHMTCKNRPDMTYIVLSGTLSLYTTTITFDVRKGDTISYRTGWHKH